MATAFGRYELVQKIAEGGMAEVFLAVQRGPGGFEKRVAVKQILPHLAIEDEFVRMFLDEARIAASLSHPNICQIFDLGEERGRYYLAMEYLSGPSLAQLVLQANADRAPLPPVLGAFILFHAAEGLAYAHEKKGPTGESLGIVHRDISPQNIVVTREGQVKLVDFGIARAEDRLVQTQAGRIRGNLLYMSPEQVTGKTVDPRSDVFSLGIVLHELLSSRPLFRQDPTMGTMEKIVRGQIPPLPRRSGVPSALNDIAMEALARSLDERLPSAREFARRLEEALRSSQPAPTTQSLAEYVRAQFPERPIREQKAARWRTETFAPSELQGPAVPSESSLEADTDSYSLAPREQRKTRALTDQLSEPAPPSFPRTWRLRAGLSFSACAVAVAIYSAVAARAPASPPLVQGPAAPVSALPAPLPMAEQEGRLTLDTTPATEVYLQGQRLGRTPLNNLPLAAGHHRLRAVNLEANTDRIIEVEVISGQTTALKVAW